MKPRYLVLPGLVLGVALALSAASTSAQSAPSPTAGARLIAGLLSPKGLKIGPDGMIYIAEAGTGGDITPAGPNAGSSGFSGRISKIDPATGTRTTVADSLPSNSFGGVEGPADVAFMGGQLYYLQARGGEFYGFPDNPTGLYRVNADGTVTLVADIGAFNIGHPIGDTQEFGGGGVPAAIAVRDGTFLIAEGSEVFVGSARQDQVLKITTKGVITRVAEFPGNPVLSGIATSDSGPLYVAALGQIPFLASDSAVYQVGYPTGSITRVAGGFSAMDDVQVGPGGQLFALSFGDFSPGGPGLLGSGRVFKLDAAAGTLTPIVTGLTHPTKFTFSGDTGFVVNKGQSSQGNDGEIWKIDGVSSLAALPVPTPRSVIAAPNTGTGGTAGGGSSLAALLLIGVAGLASIAGLALVVAGKRRSPSSPQRSD